MIKTLYLVRHGHYMLSKPDPKEQTEDIKVLSLTGIEDINDLGNMLREKDHSIEKIFYSPLRRTYETALLLKKKLHVEMIPSEKIKEAFFKDGATSHLKEIYDGFKAVSDRALDMNNTSIAVSHRFPISLFINVESGKTFEELSKDHDSFKLIKMGGCIECKFNQSGNTYKLISHKHIV